MLLKHQQYCYQILLNRRIAHSGLQECKGELINCITYSVAYPDVRDSGFYNSSFLESDSIVSSQPDPFSYLSFLSDATGRPVFSWRTPHVLLKSLIVKSFLEAFFPLKSPFTAGNGVLLRD